MNPRKEKLMLLLQVNKKNEDEAKDHIAKNKKIIATKKEKIEVLKSHKIRMQEESIGMTIPALYENLMRFLKRIDTAVIEEMQRIALLEDQQKTYYQTYFSFHKKVKTLEKLIEKIDHELKIEEERSDQKKLDDITQKKFLSSE